jgi:hypothetical protein
MAGDLQLFRCIAPRSMFRIQNGLDRQVLLALGLVRVGLSARTSNLKQIEHHPRTSYILQTYEQLELESHHDYCKSEQRSSYPRLTSTSMSAAPNYKLSLITEQGSLCFSLGRPACLEYATIWRSAVLTLLRQLLSQGSLFLLQCENVARIIQF